MCLCYVLSGPVLLTTIRRFGDLGVSTRRDWVRCPSPSYAHLTCDTTVEKAYLSDTCAMPHENEAKACNTPSAIPSRKGIPRYGGGLSHTGPLRLCHGTLLCCDTWKHVARSPSPGKEKKHTHKHKQILGTLQGLGG